MDDITMKLLGGALTALSIIVWWLFQRHEKRIDKHDQEFVQVRREVNTEFAGRDTISRIEKTWEDKLESMQKEVDSRHRDNEGRFNRIDSNFDRVDEKLDTIIGKLMERP